MLTCAETRMPSGKVVEQYSSIQKSQDAFHGALSSANLALVYALIGNRNRRSRWSSVCFPLPAQLGFLIARNPSHSTSYVCAENGIACAVIRVSRKSSPGRSRGRFTRVFLNRDKPPSLQGSSKRQTATVSRAAVDERPGRSVRSSDVKLLRPAESH